MPHSRTPTPAQPATHSPEALSPEARAYLAESISANSLRAFRADLKIFTQWGGALPTTAQTVANFLADQAATKKGSTLARYANSLHIWHLAHGLASPVRTEVVRRDFQGIRRQQDSRPESAPPLLLADFQHVLDTLDATDARGCRNRALLALAFFGAFRRSEVVRIHIADLTPQPQGLLVGLRHSKANQTGRAETKAIARGPQGSPYCPVQLLEAWLACYRELAGPIADGPVFPAIDGDGTVRRDRPMTAANFYQLFKKALRQAGLNPAHYSPHSLRSGFITSAYLHGKDPFKIKRISGHRSQATFEGYLQDRKSVV